MTLKDTEFASLTVARSYLGQVHHSETSTLIQTKFLSIDRNNALMFTNLGLGVIASAFEEAAMLYTWTNGYLGKKNAKIAQEALAFIQGTSLEIAIKTYGLDYDAESLRVTFFRTFHVKQTTC